MKINRTRLYYLLGTAEALCNELDQDDTRLNEKQQVLKQQLKDLISQIYETKTVNALKDFYYGFYLNHKGTKEGDQAYEEYKNCEREIAEKDMEEKKQEMVLQAKIEDILKLEKIGG